MITLALIDQVGGWWDNLDLARQVFYGIGIAAGFVSVILAVLAFVGMEQQDAIDVSGADFGHGGGGIFSVKPLTGFFLGFGWVGGMALDAGWTFFAAFVTATAAGAVLMALVVLMFRAIYTLRSDGTTRIDDSVGAVGTVYLTLPPRKGVGGQVIVNFKGRQETLMALSTADAAIASGEKVRVVSVVDGRTVLVEAL